MRIAFKFLFWVLKVFLKILILLIIVIALAGWWGLKKVNIKEPKLFGVTYSARNAEDFGMSRKGVFTEILDDLKVRHIRLPVYWTEVEKENNQYDFSEIDWQLREAEKREAEIILAVGRKLPRWPECFVPKWVSAKKDRNFEEAELFEYIETTVQRYKNSPALKIWQVENEPFLPFGRECSLFGDKVLEKEIAIVKKIDGAHPVLITDSGELSFWVRAAKRSDIFGTTMYREIWNEYLGFFTYPLPSQFFRVKLALTELIAGKRPAIVSELQAEPWQKEQSYELSPEDTLSVFYLNQFKDHIIYAKNSGFDEFYLWGVEWWYWLKINGHPEIWNEAKKLF